MSSSHSGSCRKLVSSLEQVLPEKFDGKFEFHRGSGDDCFQMVVEELVNQAVDEPALAKKYALIFQEISELFQATQFDGTTTNQFKRILNNQLQHNLVSIRKNSTAYTSHDDFVDQQEKIIHEKDQIVQNNLKTQQEFRLKTRQIATGTVKLTAELFNVGFMTFRIMELVMKELLCSREKPTEMDIECFHILITTIGAKFESQTKGITVCDSYLSRLEHIVDERVEEFCLRIRYMILDIYELRANGWKSLEKEQPKEVEKIKKLPSKLVEEAKATGNFLKELKAVLCQLDSEHLFDFMNRFMVISFDSDERLEGSVKVIFLQAMASPEKSMYSLVCKGLVGVTAPSTVNPNQKVTFEFFLKQMCQNEIELHRKNATQYRQLSQDVRNLIEMQENTESLKLKSALEKICCMTDRARSFSSLISELYNADFFQSRFIFDYFTVLFSAELISNTSIDCFCLMIKLVGPKILKEENRDILIKDCFSKLQDAIQNIEISQHAQFMVDETISMCRLQFKLKIEWQCFGSKTHKSRVYRPRSSRFSQTCLWNSTSSKKPRKAKLEGNDRVIKPPVEYTLNEFRNHAKNTLPCSTPFAGHQNVLYGLENIDIKTSTVAADEINTGSKIESDNSPKN